jgi:HPt (histidine-containing phosphotransfer) domain-containing protein
MTNSTDPFAELSDDEVRILPADYALKKIIGNDVDIRQFFSAENIEKAQQVINDHKESFLEWVLKDIHVLEESYANAMTHLATCEPEIRKLAKTAFVIKSQAGTFGFGLATQVAKSLDDFCNQHFHPVPEHMKVIEKHIETLKVIFQKNITGDGGALGKELNQGLVQLIEKYKGK